MVINQISSKASLSNIEEKYDVIVVGGGPAGIGAALASGMNDAKTLILESKSQFGGTWTAALWMPINYIFVDNQKNSRGGVNSLLVDKIDSYGKDASCPGKKVGVYGANLGVHPDFLKLAIFELFEEFNIDYKLYSPVTGVIKDGDKLKGVKTTTKEGELLYKADVIVDATGDGDVAWYSGCEMEEGQDEGNQHMPMALIFALSNADEERFERFMKENKSEFDDLVATARKDEKYLMSSWYSYDRTTVPGMVSINNGGIGNMDIDGTKIDDLTNMERLGIQIATDFVSFAREYEIPGLEDCYLARTGDYVAIRDTRRLVGEYTLTKEDILEGREFKDAIAMKYGRVEAIGFGYGQEIKSPPAAYPYRSLLPRQTDNLLVAGRCGSATFMGHATGKSMGNMISIGQGAGVAASLAAKQKVEPRRLEVSKVQRELSEMGVDVQL